MSCECDREKIDIVIDEGELPDDFYEAKVFGEDYLWAKYVDTNEDASDLIKDWFC